MSFYSTVPAFSHHATALSSDDLATHMYHSKLCKIIKASLPHLVPAVERNAVLIGLL
jgi:hypothetical protein